MDWLELLWDGAVVNTGTDRLYNVPSGRYTLVARKYGHVARIYNLNIGTQDIQQDIKICPIGDVTGDGSVTVGDVGKLYAHIKGTTQITDAYVLECANVNGGALTVGTVGRLYAHVRSTRPLF